MIKKIIQSIKNFFVISEEKKKLNNFIKKVGIPKKFWIITFFGYLVTYSFKSLGIILILPLVKGLINEDYSFIFQVKIINIILMVFPSIKEFSDNKIFIIFALTITFLIGISMFLSYLIATYVWTQRQKFVMNTNSFMLDYYLRPESDFFTKYRASELRAKFVEKGNNLSTYVTHTSNLMNQSFNLFTMVGSLFFISKTLALVALPFLVIYFVIFNFTKVRMKEKSKELNDSNIQYNFGIQDILHKHSLIQIFNKQKDEKENFINSTNKNIQKGGNLQKINNILDSIATVFETSSLFAMGFIIGNSLLFKESVGLSGGFVFMALFQRSLAITNNFSNIFLNRELVIDLMAKTLDTELDNDLVFKNNLKEFSKVKNFIKIKNLTFGYEEKIIFNNFNINIKANKINFILGKNGSGKTTLVSLIMRLKKPPKNSIFIDGVDLLNFDLNSLRTKISYVSQDVKFFYGTIRENIGYGNKCEDGILMEALEKVGLKTFVENLPEGLGTLMIDDGVNFSGGERQRFAIVQALLNDSEIIIFDEATKSVDYDNEAIIMNMLVKEFNNKTRIVISHNKEHIKLAEHVIDLDLKTI